MAVALVLLDHDATIDDLVLAGLVLLDHDGLVLGLAGPPEEEGDAQGGEGHYCEGRPVQLQHGKVNCYFADTN